MGFRSENRGRPLPASRGNSSTTRETVETFLLYRAAELTVENGFDYFVVSEQDTEANKRYSTSPNPAFYGRYYYGYGPYCCAFPYYAYGWGWGGAGYGDYSIPRIHPLWRSPRLLMHKGQKPADNPEAFDARSVIDNLRAYVIAQPELDRSRDRRGHSPMRAVRN